jgi:microcystin-dependent protein
MATFFKNISARTATMAAVLAAAPVLALPGTAQACGPEPYIGMVCMTAATFCPRGYEEAAGQLVAISSNPALFSLLGTNYGGDGRTTFGLPDLRGRVPVGLGNGPGLSLVTQGEKRGAEDYTMSILQMPSHNHSAQATFTPSGGETTVDVSEGTANAGSPSAGSYLATPSGATIYRDGSPDPTVALGGVSTTPFGGTVNVNVLNQGGNQPFPVVNPGIGMRFCIATVGIFPPRN